MVPTCTTQEGSRPHLAVCLKISDPGLFCICCGIMTQALRWKRHWHCPFTGREGPARVEDLRKKTCSAARVYDGSGSWLELASSLVLALKVNAREIDKCGDDNGQSALCQSH